MFGSKGSDSGDMPKHIQEIDHIVCIAEREIRVVLVSVYGMGGSFREKALALGINRMTLKRRLERAEWHVNAALDGFVPVEVHSVAACKLSSPRRI
jgi:DNA invertase Pin-like site-specific DNA recombinase